VVDAHIQIAGFDIILLDKFLAESKVQVAAKYKNTIDLTQPIKAAQPKLLSASDLATLYEGKNVPAHRYLSF